MNRYYITFGQKDHRRNGYIEIEAINFDRAFYCAKNRFKEGFSMIYEENEFEKTFYPDGCLEKIIYGNM